VGLVHEVSSVYQQQNYMIMHKVTDQERGALISFVLFIM